MSSRNSCLKICRHEYRKIRKEFKVYLVLILLFLFLLQYTQGMFDYSRSLSYPVTPWLLPFVMCGKWGRIIVFGCAILFFGNVLEFRHAETYVYLRAGWKNYFVGKYLYIISMAFLYTLAVWLLVLLPHLNDIYFANEWGKLLGEWGRHSYLHTYAGIPGGVPYILKWYEPLEGMLYSFVLTWMNISFIGVVHFFVNSLNCSLNGTVVSSCFLVLDYFIQNAAIASEGVFLMKLSPLSWSNLNMVENGGYVIAIRHPTIQYVMIMSIALILILGTIHWILSRYSYQNGHKKQWIIFLKG